MPQETMKDGLESNAGAVATDAVSAHWLDRLENLLAALARPVSAIGVLGMLVAAGATVVDVTLRWLFGGGLVALNEIIAFSFAIAVAACLPAGAARRINLAVDVFSDTFSPRTAAVLRAIGAILLCLFIGLLTWHLALLSESLKDQGRRTLILQLLQWPFIAGSTLLFGLATIVQAVVAANTVRHALGVPSSPGPPTQAATFLNILFATVGVLTLIVGALTIYDMPSVSSWVQDHAALALVLIFVFALILLLGMIPLAAVVGLVGIVGGAYFIGFKPNLSALATDAVGYLSN
jgi:C4-dicarboxylate transporter DctM subunit